MIEFFKYLSKSPGKIAFLVFAGLMCFLTFRFFPQNSGDNPAWVVTLVLAFITALNLICWLHVWLEYKKK